MKDLITEIVKALVDQPDEVSVNEIEGSHTIVLEVRVAKMDMGKVIGKRGITAQAIRTILSAASGKIRKNYMFELVER
ncbi:MAG TPA: KH domain-containing protein [Desulfobacterales bacterium]|nr:KH domain-containing protein [Desulfobacterales bacterium]